MPENVCIDIWVVQLNQQLERGLNRPPAYALFRNFQLLPQLFNVNIDK